MTSEKENGDVRPANDSSRFEQELATSASSHSYMEQVAAGKVGGVRHLCDFRQAVWSALMIS